MLPRTLRRSASVRYGREICDGLPVPAVVERNIIANLASTYLSRILEINLPIEINKINCPTPK